MSQSKVQQLMQQIDREYQAAQWGLSGLAQGIAQHEFITARLENMENTRQVLEKLVGAEEATKLVVGCMNKQADNQFVDEELLTTQEVAKRLRVHDSTVRRWIKSGYLEAIPLPKGEGQKQFYRIERSTLNMLLKRSQPTPRNE